MNQTDCDTINRKLPKFPNKVTESKDGWTVFDNNTVINIPSNIDFTDWYLHNVGVQLIHIPKIHIRVSITLRHNSNYVSVSIDLLNDNDVRHFIDDLDVLNKYPL